MSRRQKEVSVKFCNDFIRSGQLTISVIFSLVGTILVVMIMVDVIWTTITTKGSGPLSRHLVHALKGLFLFFYQCSGSRKVLVLAGPGTLIAVGLFWLIGLWLGWFSLLLGVGGVVEAKTGSPASVVQYLYYMGMTLSTLGIGDYKAGSDFTRLLTTLAAFNGLVLVTLIITYAIPMVGGITTRRKAAYAIYLLGGSRQALVEKFKNEDALRDLAAFLRNSTSDILECAEQRFAYPLLDCFHSLEKEFSLGLQLAILDEALQGASSLESVKDDRVINYQLSYFRNGVFRYLNSSAGTPQEEISELERKEAFHRVVLDEGWKWADVRPD